ncbi:hypothetical protein A2U01_0055865, partial [Trifolium medium]|nr:hypothetical protein [Trifolium medium]
RIHGSGVLDAWTSICEGRCVQLWSFGVGVDHRSSKLFLWFSLQRRQSP